MSVEIEVIEKKVREERAQVWSQVEEIMERWDANGDLSGEDREKYDKLDERMEKLNGDLDRAMKSRKRNSAHAEEVETRHTSEDELTNENLVHEKSFREWFLRGKEADTEALSQMRRREHDPVNMELRAPLDSNALATVPGQGGFMIPQGFWHNLQIAMKAYGGVLDHTNIQKTATGNEMPWPTTNPTGVVGSYLTEANQVGFTDFTLGQGILYAWTITSGVILASYQLLNDSAFSVDSFVSDRMGEAIGRKVAQELWSGAGSASKNMTGITTAITANGGAGSGQTLTTLTNSAITASGPGYVTDTSTPGGSTGHASKIFTLASPSTAILAVGTGIASWGALNQMISGVDPAYRIPSKCAFYMNDTQVQLQRQLTDGFGHPLWEPNTQAGQPDTILGYPVVIDNNSPSVSLNASTSGGIVFGDLKTAFIVRQVDMAGTMRLTERYADYLSVGYLGYVRMDSQPNDLRAISVYATSPAS